jgi:hemerythrin-like metal-binding protein
MTIQWLEKNRVGDLNDDDQHLEWFQLANGFLFATDLQDKHEAGNAFRQFTGQHFMHEEEKMRDAQFPFALAHVEEHKRLFGTLNQILDVANGDTLSKTELEDFMGYCLTKHIALFDAPMELFVRRSGMPKRVPTKQ